MSTDLAELHALLMVWRHGKETELSSEYHYRQKLADELAAALRKMEQDSAATGAQGEAVAWCYLWPHIDTRNWHDIKNEPIPQDSFVDNIKYAYSTPAPRGVTDAHWREAIARIFGHDGYIQDYLWEGVKRHLAALSDGNPARKHEDAVLVPKRVIAFLNGQVDYEGQWFGDAKDGRVYWWRSLLPPIIASDLAPAEPREGKG